MTENSPNPGGMQKTPFFELVPILKQGRYKNKVLYFVDAVGRQVEWLQYYLKQNGYEKYYFLQGGAAGILAAR